SPSQLSGFLRRAHRGDSGDRPATVVAPLNDASLQGRQYREAAAPGETRHNHSSRGVQPGRTCWGEVLDLTGQYQVPPGRHSVRVIYDDLPLRNGPGITSRNGRDPGPSCGKVSR